MKLLALLTLAAAPALFAQSSIHASPDGRQWYLEAGQSSYVLGIDDQNMLQTIFWGPKLGASAVLPPAHSHRERASFDPGLIDAPLEYAGWGGGLSTEPALKITSPNGDRTLVLVYDSAKLQPNQLEIILHDTAQPVTVHLFYHVYPEGIIARWSRIENTGKQPFHVEQAASATLNLPRGEGYDLTWITGQWAGEWQLHTAPIEAGTRMLESRRGSTSHQSNPWFSIGRAGETTERSGPAWFGELGWSGSWRMSVESTALHLVRVTAGYNPFDFAYVVKPGASLETPPFYAGYTSHGLGEASRILHRFQLAQILPTHPDPKPRPLVNKNLEAPEVAVDEPNHIAHLEKAAKLGVERFVIDDGWFGARLTDHAGLGDWQVNPTKFPHGLKPLIDRVHTLGMDFGLWVEPEMVNPDSDLYRAHPDWAMHFPNRQRTEARNQLVLNLARPDVKEFVFAFLDKIVKENDIAFLKWDYNRNWSEPGWEEPTDGEAKEIYVRYVQNLYEILDRLRTKYPKLEIESCSGGGGRVDLGILKYTDEVWPSDNTDAFDRLSLQYGFTHAYTPEVMVAWVTDTPRRQIPLKFRFLVAMQGALGIGSNLNNFTPQQMSESEALTAFYKTIRTTVQHGNLFRLASPVTHDASQVEYVSQDGKQAVLLAYLHSQHFGIAYPTVRLDGLEPDAMYRIRPLDPKQYTGSLLVQGSVLMGKGIDLSLGGDYDSTALVFERQTNATR